MGGRLGGRGGPGGGGGGGAGEGRVPRHRRPFRRHPLSKFSSGPHHSRVPGTTCLSNRMTPPEKGETLAHDLSLSVPSFISSGPDVSTPLATFVRLFVGESPTLSTGLTAPVPRCLPRPHPLEAAVSRRGVIHWVCPM